MCTLLNENTYSIVEANSEYTFELRTNCIYLLSFSDTTGTGYRGSEITYIQSNNSSIVNIILPFETLGSTSFKFELTGNKLKVHADAYNSIRVGIIRIA